MEPELFSLNLKTSRGGVSVHQSGRGGGPPAASSRARWFCLQGQVA